MDWKHEANGRGIAVNRSGLSSEGAAALVGRENELANLTVCLAPMRRGDRPLNVWLCGPVGSGKTLLARRVVDEFASANRVTAYVNCWSHGTLYQVLQAIVDDLKILGAEAQDTNVKFDRIRQALRGRPAVIILDEIDRTVPVQRDAIIHGLLDLSKAGVICIAENTGTLSTLNERVKSRLSPLVIKLAPYTPKQLEAILEHWARHALEPGSWAPTVMRRIGAGPGGDARAAVEMLRQAVFRAQAAGRSTIDRRDVTTPALSRCGAVRRDRLTTLTEHERIIHQLVAHHGPIGTTNLRARYVAECRDQDIDPVARRTFSKYLARLGARGFLRIPARAASIGGRIVRAA